MFNSLDCPFNYSLRSLHTQQSDQPPHPVTILVTHIGWDPGHQIPCSGGGGRGGLAFTSQFLSTSPDHVALIPEIMLVILYKSNLSLFDFAASYVNCKMVSKTFSILKPRAPPQHYAHTSSQCIHYSFLSFSDTQDIYPPRARSG